MIHSNILFAVVVSGIIMPIRGMSTKMYMAANIFPLKAGLYIDWTEPDFLVKQNAVGFVCNLFLAIPKMHNLFCLLFALSPETGTRVIKMVYLIFSIQVAIAFIYAVKSGFLSGNGQYATHIINPSVSFSIVFYILLIVTSGSSSFL